MLNDLFLILYWWLVLLGLGIIFLPLTAKIFSRFWDKGYLFSKVLAIAFVSYTVWLLGSLKILPFFRETILLVILGWIVLGLYLIQDTSNKAAKQQSNKAAKIKIFVGEELLFLICLMFWAFIRGFQPDIEGLEKFMDYGFVNTILRTEFFPPKDMWFAGGNINYYYFGHFITALLTKLTGLDSAITYNLQIATLFAFAFTLTFSLASNLLHINSNIEYRNSNDQNPKQIGFRILATGLLSALLLTLGANLHPAWYNFKLRVLHQPYCDGALTYWYPNATRYIGYCPEVEDKTIHEFPSYSFVVSDLHGHVSNIPFVLTFLALLFLSFTPHQKGKTLRKDKAKFWWARQALRHHSSNPNLFLLPLFLAIFYITNQWDLPIYLIVLGLNLLWVSLQEERKLRPALIRAFLNGALILLLTLLLTAPFFLNFDSLITGVGLVRAHSLPHQLLILWGAPWFFAATFILLIFKDKIRLALQKEWLVKKFSQLLSVSISLKKNQKIQDTRYKIQDTDIFVLILILISTLLVFIPEVLYVKDIYIPSYHRANTMFKLTYQAFIMYSITSAYVIVRVLSSLKKGFPRSLLVISYSLLVFCLMSYPYFAINSYYGNLRTYQGLYGLNFLRRLYPDNYQAVLWFQQNVVGQPVILEASGDSYTNYNQVSMATGLPTIEGWLVHEWLWRGGFDEPGKRASEVQQMYEADLTITQNLLKKYQVSYVIVSNLEREKYPHLNEAKFASLGKLVFSSGATKIFKTD